MISEAIPCCWQAIGLDDGVMAHPGKYAREFQKWTLPLDITGNTMRKVTKENDIFSQLEMHFKI